MNKLGQGVATTVGLEIVPLQAFYIGKTEAAQAGEQEGLPYLRTGRKRRSGQETDFLNSKKDFSWFGLTRALCGREPVHGIGRQIAFAGSLVEQAGKDIEVVPLGSL